MKYKKLSPEIKEFKNLLTKYGWLFLAHHPLCDSFSDHTIRIKNYYICKGCFFGYLGIISMFVLFYVFPYFNYMEYLFLMVIFFTISQLIKINIKFGILSKLFLGCNLGSGLLVILNVPDIIMKLLFSYLFTNIALIYITLRYVKLSKICIGCSHFIEMPECPGLKNKSEIKGG
jgi:hypothetical protein